MLWEGIKYSAVISFGVLFGAVVAGERGVAMAASGLALILSLILMIKDYKDEK